jgi:hypothetical protein
VWLGRQSPLVQFAQQLLQKAQARMSMRSAATKEMQLADGGAPAANSKRSRQREEAEEEDEEDDDEDDEDDEEEQQQGESLWLPCTMYSRALYDKLLQYACEFTLCICQCTVSSSFNQHPSPAQAALAAVTEDMVDDLSYNFSLQRVSEAKLQLSYT